MSDQVLLEADDSSGNSLYVIAEPPVDAHLLTRALCRDAVTLGNDSGAEFEAASWATVEDAIDCLELTLGLLKALR